jgi:hypothetical protein
MAQTWLTAALWVGLALIARWLSIRYRKSAKAFALDRTSTSIWMVNRPV